MIVADRDSTLDRWPSRSKLVRTPLDLVRALTLDVDRIASVILVGEFARDREFAAFVESHHPSVCIVIASATVSRGQERAS
jgi:hypothetical protein